MKTVTFNFPDTLELDNDEVAMIVAARLYEQGYLSPGQAYAIVGSLTNNIIYKLPAWRRNL